MANTGYDECVGLTRFLMSIVGTWPDAKRAKRPQLNFLGSLFFMIFFINIPQTRKLFLVYDDLNEVIEILTVADLMMLLAVFKLLGVWHNKGGKTYLTICW